MVRSPRISLQQLRALLAVYDEGGFRRAAERLNTSQSAVSRTIQTLEAELGVPVFDRSARGVKPNSVGKNLLQYARTIVGGLDEISIKALSAIRGEVGQLKIGYNEISIRTFLPKVLAKFHRQYPNVDLRLISQATSEMIPENTAGTISRGEVDIGFVVGPVLDDELEAIHLFEDHVALAVAKTHRLAQRESISASELKDEHILLWSTEPWQIYTRRINNICRQAGFLPRPSIMMQDNESAFALVEENIGVVLIASSVAATYSNRVATVAIRENPEPFHLYAAWRKDNTAPALRNFIDIVSRSDAGG
ncbi:putative DNA-binding transcriptional dual regulator [Mesorhizobium plurifarium]|uniref:Putative DNA-binding transcriptional dual regulator n=1 Tax=Mesorhizobium plurifarium TaxID=69974 RepID=A0A090GGH2_MESPL|nr:putative DNA-binding transcriptional dual regulator [Mesorhizobium plurifarium]